MTIAAVRQGIADALGTISGLRVSPYATDTVNVPHAMVIRRELTYATSESGTFDGVFGVRVFVNRSGEVAGQKLLDGYCETVGATSVKAALDGKLGGACHYCVVKTVSEADLVVVGDVAYVMVEFDLEVAF